MTTKKRSREEMVAAILRHTRQPETTVSQITQMVSLPWNSWKSISGELLERGLLVKVDGHYRTTEKGLEWLRLREEMGKV